MLLRVHSGLVNTNNCAAGIAILQAKAADPTPLLQLLQLLVHRLAQLACAHAVNDEGRPQLHTAKQILPHGTHRLLRGHASQVERISFALHYHDVRRAFACTHEVCDCSCSMPAPPCPVTTPAQVQDKQKLQTQKSCTSDG
jgi:hypothetical protein